MLILLKVRLLTLLHNKLQTSLSESLSMGMVVIQPCILVSKLKNKTMFLRYTGYLNSIKSYKGRCVAYSSSFRTSELSVLLASCHITVKNMSLSTASGYIKDPIEKVYKRSNRNLFLSIKNSGEVLFYVLLYVTLYPF